jgi:putative NADH-flavin reductase
MVTSTPTSAQPPLVAVLGATGRLGRHVITHALDRGYRVRAIVHQTRVESSHPLLGTWPADVRRPETVHDALAGADLVISCLGSASAESPTVQTLGGSALREAMMALSLTRLVSVTGSGTSLPGEPLTPHHQAKRNQMLAVAPHLLADGDRHLATLAATSLAWTVVRVPLMTHGQQKNGYTLQSQAAPPAATVAYRHAAQAMLALATDPEGWIRTAPFLATAVLISHCSLAAECALASSA